MADFSDFRNFSALRGSEDRDRTTADRDLKAEGVERHSRPLPWCRREGNRTAMSRGFARGFTVFLMSRPRGAGLPTADEPARGPGLMIIRPIAGGVEVFAPAKLNLFLEVLGRRPDGYHEIETVMVAVSLYEL